MNVLKIVAATVLLGCAGSTLKGAETGEGHAVRAREALVGTRAPAAAMEVLDGDRVQLQDLVGRKPVYLKFWATWCLPCQRQMPHLEAAHHTYGDRIAMFAVDLGLNDSVDDVRAFQAAYALTVPIAIDGDGSLAERFQVAVTPQHVLIDRAGVVRYVGHLASAELDSALEALVRDDAAPVDRPRVAPVVDEPLSLSLLDGSTFTLAAHAGQPIALTFMSTSCDWYLAKSRPAMSEACIAHARQVESLQRTRGRIVWVAVAHPVWSSAASVEKYRKRLAVDVPIGIDETSAWFHRFRVRDVPTTILLDERGVEIERVDGRGDDLPRALARLPGATR
jgi:thiol-disulfide isomerase/thioredoxin